MKIVLDEWLWADLAGENQATHQQESFCLLNEIFQRCDQLVTVAGSAFLSKLWVLAKRPPTEVLRKSVKVFKAQFFLNSEKLKQCEENEVCSLPREIEARVKEDDQYLVRAYRTANADVLVTTDRALIQALGQHNIRCRSREDFLREYLAGK